MLPHAVRYDERAARRQAVRYAAMAAVFGLGFPLAAWFGYTVGVPVVLIVLLLVMAVAGGALFTFLARSHARERAQYDWLAYELTADGIRLPVLGTVAWRDVALVTVIKRDLKGTVGRGPFKAAGSLGVRAVDGSTQERDIGIRLRDPSAFAARLPEAERRVVTGREDRGIPHGMVSSLGLPIPFAKAADAIRDAATRHGVGVHEVENLRDR